MKFELDETDGTARAGLLRTAHGDVETPVFMPVGTRAAVKTLAPRDLEHIGARIILANTYHLVLRPGVDIVGAAGGLHEFMAWRRPILTDSGGFQVMSLADLRKVSDDGITFRSHIDGALHHFTPERAIEDQVTLGADIIMSFDYCTRHPCSRAEAEQAVALTTRWARRGAEVYGTRFDHGGYARALFGIVQGATYPDLRDRSRDALVEIDFPGYAIGGLSVGEERVATFDMVRHTAAGLPLDKPRYLMGMGTPLDLVDGVANGIDMFDCVMPTRNARNGTVFTRNGVLNLKNASNKDDFTPVDETCECYTCRNFSRSYLRHLIQSGEILGLGLATLHSLHFYCSLMREIREAIQKKTFDGWRSDFVARYTTNTASDGKQAHGRAKEAR